MVEKYTVTAAVTTYKRDWKIVRRALDSIIRQTRPADEILLIDDNDPDSEYSRIKSRSSVVFPVPGGPTIKAERPRTSGKIFSPVPLISWAMRTHRLVISSVPFMPLMPHTPSRCPPGSGRNPCSNSSRWAARL